MSEGKINGRFNYRQTLAIAIISAALSGSGVPYFLSAMGVNPYRDDPFTGAEGRLLDRRLDALEVHVADHPDVELRAAISGLTADIAAAKAERELILRNQDRILDRMEK